MKAIIIICMAILIGVIVYNLYGIAHGHFKEDKEDII